MTARRAPAPQTLEQILRRRVGEELPGLEEGPSRFGGGLAFRKDGRELAHLHPHVPPGPDVTIEVDVRVPRAQQKGYRDDPRATFRPRPSDWMEVRVVNEGDLDLVGPLIVQLPGARAGSERAESSAAGLST